MTAVLPFWLHWKWWKYTVVLNEEIKTEMEIRNKEITCKLGTCLSITGLNSDTCHREEWRYAHCSLMAWVNLVQNNFFLFMKMKKSSFKILNSFCRMSAKWSQPQQKCLYFFTDMHLFMCYNAAIFCTAMTSFQHLHKKIAESQILRTVNPSPELHIH